MLRKGRVARGLMLVTDPAVACASRRPHDCAMRNLWWMFPVAVFFLNPSFACSDEPQLQYGAAEMLAVVTGDWSLTITPDGGTATQVTVHVEQAAAPATAARSARF